MVTISGVHKVENNYFQELSILIKLLGLKERVRFCGSHKQIAEVYALSDGRGSDARRPIIGTARGGMLDIVKNDVTERLFQLSDSRMLAEQIKRLVKQIPSGLMNYV